MKTEYKTIYDPELHEVDPKHPATCHIILHWVQTTAC